MRQNGLALLEDFAFQACAIDHSAISPLQKTRCTATDKRPNQVSACGALECVVLALRSAIQERISVKFFARSSVAHHFAATNYCYWIYGLAESVGFVPAIHVVINDLGPIRSLNPPNPFET